MPTPLEEMLVQYGAGYDPTVLQDFETPLSRGGVGGLPPPSALKLGRLNARTLGVDRIDLGLDNLDLGLDSDLGTAALKGFTPQSLTGLQGFFAGKGGSTPGGRTLPTFEDMFGKFLELGRRETERQAAGFREAFGKQGARVGSDLLRHEGAFRAQAGENLSRAGLDAITQLGNLALGAGDLETRLALQRAGLLSDVGLRRAGLLGDVALRRGEVLGDVALRRGELLGEVGLRRAGLRSDYLLGRAGIQSERDIAQAGIDRDIALARAAAEEQARNQALQLQFQDFLRQTGLPLFAGPAGDFASRFVGPDYLATAG